MPLVGIGACGDKNAKFRQLFKERQISGKGKVFGKPIWFDLKAYFFRNESMFCKPFPKKTNQYSWYLPSSFRAMY